MSKFTIARTFIGGHLFIITISESKRNKIKSKKWTFTQIEALRLDEILFSESFPDHWRGKTIYFIDARKLK
jgi:hypothetical protein